MSIIDGIVSCNYNFIGEPICPETLLVGNEPLEVDKVSMDYMGLDCYAKFPETPFESCENYLTAFSKGQEQKNTIVKRSFPAPAYKYTLNRMRPYTPEMVKEWVSEVTAGVKYCLKHRNELSYNFV